MPAGELREALLASLRFRAFPEVAGALARCANAQSRLVVVSNWDFSLHGMLAARRPEGAASTARSARRGCGVAKPDPAIFARALALAGAAPADALHVGDSLSYDVAGARAAGIEAVLVVRHGGAPRRGCRAVRSLAELAPGAA